MAATFFQHPLHEANLRFAIGVDFGATSSGANVKFSGDCTGEQDLFIGRWTSGHTGSHSTLSDVKIPTRLALGGPGQDAGKPARWGFQVPDDERSFRWFKLGLVHRDDVSDGDSDGLFDDLQASTELKEAESLRDQQRTTATKLTEEYLRNLWKHIVEQIASRLRITEDDVRASEMHVVIGIPANSKPATVSRLKCAAKAAGIPGYRHPLSSIDFCIEPEAAAVALVEHGGVSLDLTSGDVIIVCDCGGGTADAASYEVISTQPFELEECLPGKARFCGPVLLDGIFKGHIEQKVQQAADSLNTGPVPTDDVWALYTRLWDHRIKRMFDGSPGHWTEAIPGHLTTARGKRAGLRSAAKHVGFTGGELEAILDPTLHKILGLVRQQVEGVWQKLNKLPKSVIVCGGFSENPYLRIKMEEQVKNLNQEYSGQQTHDTNRPIRFEVAPDIYNRRLVAMGCAIRAYKEHCEHLDSSSRASAWVASRIARASYGIYSGKTILPRQFVAKGDSLLVAEPPRVVLTPADFAFQEGNGAATVDIYQGQEAQLKRDTMMQLCRLTWTGVGLDRLVEAFHRSPPRSVELAVHYATHNVTFVVLIDGEVQLPGVEAGLVASYEMYDAA
ncbi:hypothetical protein C8A00DRAFT_34562 [Chaetomidium leptoderma]|uniref:Actin-like ATPase domain-containing protein n=1 Tax=Chaetomidium leptoderma TaxID=669021 RepID=A0AAN6VK34_9PEZI|nr:hypothetical protein C8A00DRAFT_34562 [Chaetomidium leptoderma]